MHRSQNLGTRQLKCAHRVQGAPLISNTASVARAERKRRQQGGPTTYQEVLWVRFPVGAGSSHTKDVKNRSGPSCMVFATK